MKDNLKNVPPEPTLAERRRRLADALGFLLARDWLRSIQQPQLQGKLPRTEPGDPSARSATEQNPR